MSLRPVLRPPPIDAEVLDRMIAVVARIGGAWQTGEPLDELMREHDELTGRHDIPARHYRDLCSKREERDAAVQTLRGRAPIVPDITREELVEIVRRIRDDPKALDMIWWLDLYMSNTAAGDDWNPLLWLDDQWIARIGTAEPTAEQIVDETLRAT